MLRNPKKMHIVYTIIPLTTQRFELGIPELSNYLYVRMAANVYFRDTL